MNKLKFLLLPLGAFALMYSAGVALEKHFMDPSPPGVEQTITAQLEDGVAQPALEVESYVFDFAGTAISLVDREAIEPFQDPPASCPLIYLPRMRGQFQQGYNYSYTGQYRKPPVRCGPINA